MAQKPGARGRGPVRLRGEGEMRAARPLNVGWFLSLLILAALPGRGAGSGPGPEGAEFFEKRVRPVLVEHCYQCHSAQAKKARGGLRLDSRAGLLKGGDSGPAVVPGEPGKSRL